MAGRMELMIEAERRGILPPDKKALLDEARRRGLVGGQPSAAPEVAPAQAAPTESGPISGPYVPFVDDQGARAPAPRVSFAPEAGRVGAAPQEATQAASIGASMPTEPAAPEYAKSTTQAMVEGSASPALIPVGAGALRAPTVVGRMVRGSGAAAGGGALFGAATGEGDVGDVAARAGGIGATGGVLGFGAPLLFNVIGKGFNAVGGRIVSNIKRLSARERGALKTVMKAFRDDGIPTDEARKRLKEWADQGGEPAALFDLGGPAVERLARSLGSRQSRSATLLQGEVDERLAGQADEVADALARTVSRETNYAGAVEGLHVLRQKQAAPLYERAYQDTVSVTGRLQSLLSRPSVRRALRRADRIAQEEGVDLTQLGLVRSENGALQFSDRVNVRVLDYLKRGLDDELARFRDPVSLRMNHTQESRVIDQTRRGILKETDKQSPAYAEARKVWSGTAESLDALSLGKDIFRPSVTPEAMAKRLKRMGEGDREYLRAGVVKAIIDKVENTVDGANVVKRFFNREAFRKKLRLIFGSDEQVDSFEALMRRQLTKAERTQRVAPTFGSQTQLRGADAAAREGAGDALLSGAKAGGIVSAAARGAARALRSKRAQQRQDAENEVIFRMLFEKDNPLGVLEQGAAITGPSALEQIGGRPAVLGPAFERRRRTPEPAQ